MLLVEFIELYHVTKVCTTVTIPRFYKLKANKVYCFRQEILEKEILGFYSVNGKMLPNHI